MIEDVFLRWVVTALFALSAAESLYATATSRREWPHAVGHVLHLVMSVAMAVMAWPRGATLPTVGPMVFFLIAATWFAALVFVGLFTDRGKGGHRAANAYHALMMLAMAWMYAVMNGNLLPGQRGTTEGMDEMNMPTTTMPGMEMPGMDTSSPPPAHPVWIDAVNWICTIGFVIASVWWLYRLHAGRGTGPGRPWHRFLGLVRQTMMAAGMAIMFAVML